MVVIASVLGAGFACTAFSDAIVREGDAGIDANNNPASSAACQSLRPPEPPAGLTDEGSITFFTVLREMKFNAPDGGTPAQFSYDLDETCTCPGRETCVPQDAGTGPRCDFEGGVDNAGGTLISQGALGGFKLRDLETYVKEGIEQGDNGIVLGVEGYSGKPNDPSVVVSLYRSLGPRDDGGAKTKPQFTPEERWTRLRPDVEEDETRPKSVRAYVKDGVLVAILQTSYLPFKDSYIELQEGRAIAKIEQIAPGRYALRDGRLVGRWTTKNVLQNLIGVIPPENDGKRLCETPTGIAVFEQLGVKRQICNAADISATSAFDKSGTLACDALSVGVAFEAVPTTPGDLVPPPATKLCEGVTIPDCTR
jgi:hypothetical protein